MGFILTALTGFVVWIVLWALDWKAFDAFMITVLIIVLGATAGSSRRTCLAAATAEPAALTGA